MAPGTEDRVEAWLIDEAGVTVGDVDLEVLVGSAFFAAVIVVESGRCKPRSKLVVDLRISFGIVGVFFEDGH